MPQMPSAPALCSTCLCHTKLMNPKTVCFWTWTNEQNFICFGTLWAKHSFRRLVTSHTAGTSSCQNMWSSACQTISFSSSFSSEKAQKCTKALGSTQTRTQPKRIHPILFFTVKLNIQHFFKLSFRWKEKKTTCLLQKDISLFTKSFCQTASPTWGEAGQALLWHRLCALQGLAPGRPLGAAGLAPSLRDRASTLLGICGFLPGHRSVLFQGAREAPSETRRHKHLIPSGGLYRLRWSGSGLWIEGVLITYSTVKKLTEDKGTMLQCLPLIWHQATSCLYPLHTVCMFVGFAIHIINCAPLPH